MTTRLIYNPMFTTVEADPDTFDIIHAHLRVTHPGRQHMANFKNRVWDGRIAMMDKRTGRFPSGLLDRVEKKLKSMKIPYEVDRSHDPSLEVNPTGLPGAAQDIIFRAWQRDTVPLLAKAKRGIAQFPEGTGKSLAIWALIEYLQRPRTFILTKAAQLVRQLAKELSKLMGEPVAILQGKGYQIGNITVGTISSTKDYLEAPDVAKALHETELLIVDECKHMAGDSAQAILKACWAPYRFGFDARPFPKGDMLKKALIEGYLGPVVASMTVQDATDKGFNAPVHIHTLWAGDPNDTEIGLEDDFDDVVLRKFILDPEIQEQVVRAVKWFVHRDIPVLVASPYNVEMMEIIVTYLRADGIKVTQVSGKQTGIQQQAIVEDFNAGKIGVLIKTKVLGEGTDMPTAAALINLAVARSDQNVGQGVGRVRRSKARAWVVEFLSARHRFLMRAYRDRLNLYIKDGYTIHDIGDWMELPDDPT